MAADLDSVQLIVHVRQSSAFDTRLVVKRIGYVVVVHNTKGYHELTFNYKGKLMEPLDFKERLCKYLEVDNLFPEMPAHESVQLFNHGITVVPAALSLDILPDEASQYIKKNFKWKGK